MKRYFKHFESAAKFFIFFVKPSGALGQISVILTRQIKPKWQPWKKHKSKTNKIHRKRCWICPKQTTTYVTNVFSADIIVRKQQLYIDHQLREHNPWTSVPECKRIAIFFFAFILERWGSSPIRETTKQQKRPSANKHQTQKKMASKLNTTILVFGRIEVVSRRSQVERANRRCQEIS